MAVSLSLIAGSKKTVEVDGRELTFSPLTLADIAFAQSWFVDKPLEDLTCMLSRIGEHMTPEDKNKAVRDAREEYELRRRVVQRIEHDKKNVDRVSNEMNVALSSLSGVALLMWLGLRHNQDISIEEVEQLVDIESIQAMQTLIDSINVPIVDPDEELQYVDYDDQKKTSDMQN